MRFVRPTFSDSHTIYEWRNDPATRKMMFNESPISWDEHSHWFEVTLWSGIHIYLVEEDGEIIGTLRFSPVDKETAEMSIIIAPERRGKGLGTRVIHDGAEWFLRTEGKRYKRVVAKVKNSNMASLKAFQKAGFHQVEKDEHGVVFEWR